MYQEPLGDLIVSMGQIRGQNPHEKLTERACQRRKGGRLGWSQETRTNSASPMVHEALLGNFCDVGDIVSRRNTTEPQPWGTACRSGLCLGARWRWPGSECGSVCGSLWRAASLCPSLSPRCPPPEVGTLVRLPPGVMVRIKRVAFVSLSA